MRSKAFLLVSVCLISALAVAQGQGGARATAWGKATPGQVNVPQDKDMQWYIDNVFSLEVQGKDPAAVKTQWGGLVKSSLSSYCFDGYKVDVKPRPMGDKGVVLEVGGKAQLVSVTELAPGQSTEWHHFGFLGEPMYYTIQGEGRSEWYSDAPPWSGGMPLKKFEWTKGGFWAIPPDHYIRHTNTGRVPTRVVEMVGYGVNLYPYIKEELRIGAENKDETDAARAKTLETATLPLWSYKDLRTLKVVPREYRGTASAFFDLAATVGHRTHPNTHVSELLRAKANAHKHDGEPWFVFLQGRGHDLWANVETLEEFQTAIKEGKTHRAVYQEGSICAVPAGPHWHQHWSEDPNHMLRYLAVVPRLKTKDRPTDDQ